MPHFKSEEESIEVHKKYRFDTDHEGKFHKTHSGWGRTLQLLGWIPDNQPLVLGIGCNSGGLEKIILRKVKGSTVYGIDIQATLVERAKQKGIMARVGKAEDLPYNDSFFDIVILSEILEHVFDPQKVLTEALRVLKKDGLMIGSVPHPRGKNAKKSPIEEHQYHARIFNKRTLKKLLSPLRNVEIVNVCYYPPLDKTPQWYAFKGHK